MDVLWSLVNYGLGHVKVAIKAAYDTEVIKPANGSVLYIQQGSNVFVNSTVTDYSAVTVLRIHFRIKVS